MERIRNRIFSAEEANRRLGESEQVIRDMAEELSSCYESLSAIFRCSSELGKTNDLEEFARRWHGGQTQRPRQHLEI